MPPRYSPLMLAALMTGPHNSASARALAASSAGVEPATATCPSSKSPNGRERLVIFTGRPYRYGHGSDSHCSFFDLRLPLSQPRRAGTQAYRASASVSRSAPTAPRSTSAFIARSAAMGVALSNLAAGHRHDGLGQARNPGRVASQGISALLALAITPSRPAQDRHGNS